MLKDYSIKDGHLHVRQTGAVIPLDATFFRDVARIAGLTMEVSAIRAARAARARIDTARRETSLRIAFAPFVPGVWYAIWPVCNLANMEIVRDPAQADILFYFDDREFAPALPAGLPGVHIINGACLDIRKSRVASVFADVFGYDLSIDPHTHRGMALMKSERNGVHDGQIVPCPYVVPRQGTVFQRLVDNTTDGRTYTDIRTPIVGNTIPLIYLKQRTASTRFSNDNIRVDLSSPAEQFSAEEQTKILEFARRIGLDFGGLDVLRDRRDGRIYIVDVNKTDMGPPTALPRAQKLVALQKLADAFRGHVDPLVQHFHAA